MRAYSEFRFCTSRPDCHLTGIANGNFEAYITQELDAFDDCKRELADCLRAAKVLNRGVYDYHIDLFMENMPHHFLCVLHNDFLVHAQTKAMTAVSKFIGLEDEDWARYELAASSTTKSDHLGEKPGELPVDPGVLHRMARFYDRFPRGYIDHTAEHGFYGCRPAIREN